jgi:hypothetical protein
MERQPNRYAAIMSCMKMFREIREENRKESEKIREEFRKE